MVQMAGGRATTKRSELRGSRPTCLRAATDPRLALSLQPATDVPGADVDGLGRGILGPGRGRLGGPGDDGRVLGQHDLRGILRRPPGIVALAAALVRHVRLLGSSSSARHSVAARDCYLNPFCRDLLGVAGSWSRRGALRPSEAWSVGLTGSGRRKLGWRPGVRTDWIEAKSMERAA